MVGLEQVIAGISTVAPLYSASLSGVCLDFFRVKAQGI